MVSALEGGDGVERWNLLFSRELRDWEILQVEELKRRLALVTLDSAKRDAVSWNWSSDNRFSVKSVYNQWENGGYLRSPVMEALWKNLCLPKVEIFAWMVLQSKVATRSVLMDRNLIIEGQSVNLCPFCSVHLETPHHLFLHCQFSWEVWSRILDWWHVRWVCPKSLEDLFIWWGDNSFRKWEQHLWEATFLATLWSLWLATMTRNAYVFNNATTSAEEVSELIKSKVAMWVKAKFDIKVYLVEGFRIFLDGVRLLKL